MADEVGEYDAGDGSVPPLPRGVRGADGRCVVVEEVVLAAVVGWVPAQHFVTGAVQYPAQTLEQGVGVGSRDLPLQYVTGDIARQEGYVILFQYRGDVLIVLLVMIPSRDIQC